MLNKVIIMGRLVRDPEMKQTNSGTAICRFSVAVDRSFTNKQTGEREADFLDCTAFGKTAEFVSRYFSKGKMILVEGEIRNNNFTDNNGVKHYSCNIAVNNVSFCGDSGNGNSGQQQYSNNFQPNNFQANNFQPAGNAGGSAGNQGVPQSLDGFETILGGGEVPF